MTLICLATVVGRFEVTAQSSSPANKKLLHAVLAKNKEGKPATKFFTGSSKIYAFWKGDALTAGDKLHAVWIAEDVGYSALKDSKITEASVTAYKPDDDGIFSLARPSTGWPVGKYRFELYVDDKLAQTLRFTIEPDVMVEVR